MSKHWRPLQKITRLQEEKEDEVEAKAVAEEAMTVAINNTINTKKINFKEEEE